MRNQILHPTRPFANVNTIDFVKGFLKSNEAKYMDVDCLNRFFQIGAQVVGSTAFFRDIPLERMYRDMQLHLLHRRHRVGSTPVGPAALGLDLDLGKIVS